MGSILSVYQNKNQKLDQILLTGPLKKMSPELLGGKNIVLQQDK